MPKARVAPWAARTANRESAEVERLLDDFRRELDDIAAWARTRNVSGYDCVIPVSGGKDSHRQALYCRDELGLKPLLATCAYPPEEQTERGAHNIANLISLGFDCVYVSPGPETWRKAMQIGVGASTNSCMFRSSVVADSSDLRSDTEVTATGSLGSSTPSKLAKKAYLGVGVRQSDNSGYELRVRPAAGNWQLFRDPRGNSEGPVLFRSGKGKFVRGGQKGNTLMLRAFDYGSDSTTLTARINNKVVVSATDTGNSQPDGRRTTVSTGIKGAGSGNGVVGIFDDVAIKVPNPFG